MKRLFFSVFFMLLLAAAPSLEARDDWQSWQMVQLRAKVHEKVTVRLQTEHWLTEDFSRLSLSNIDMGFLWSPVKYLEAGPFYRYQYIDSPTGPNTGEHRIYPEATLRYPKERWALSNRSRMEYRERARKDFWVYRNESRLTLHFKVKGIRVSPYLAEEWFYRGDTKGFTENRVSAGWQTRIHKNLGLTLFYLIHHTKGRTDWKSNQVLGATVTIYV